jgi:hypothetical protein
MVVEIFGKRRKSPPRIEVRAHARLSLLDQASRPSSSLVGAGLHVLIF